MKKVLIGVVFVMAIVIVLGVSWGKLFKRGYTQDEYGTELAQRDKKIEDLNDSIRVLQVKLGVYEKAVKCSEKRITMNCNEELNKYGVFQKMFHCHKVNLSDEDNISRFRWCDGYFLL